MIRVNSRKVLVDVKIGGPDFFRKVVYQKNGLISFKERYSGMAFD